MRIEFDNYKDNLFAAALAVHCEEHFLEIVQQLHDQGYTKMAIYELFLQFHQEIQIDPRTKDKEFVYDSLSDFMDGFTAWGKGNKILPEEEDV